MLVVGASSGIGRATGLAIAAEGGKVAFAARRRERLEEAVAEAGGGSLALECDVRDEAACERTVAEAVAALGGLDAVVYAPGIGVFKPAVEITGEEWTSVFQTNLLGATMITRAAISHLEESEGKAVYISSISIDDTPPRPHYAPYVVTKVALETLIQAWQGEHRRVGFTTIAMGDTITEFGFDIPPEQVEPLVHRWIAEGYMYGRAMEASSVADQVVNALASPETIRRLAITPRYANEDVVAEMYERRG